MQYAHVLMGEDGLVPALGGQRMETIGMQYTHVLMGEDGLVPAPGGVENMRVLLPEDGHNRDAVRACSDG